MTTMYESPKKLIRDIMPTPITSFGMVARAAGVMYLASVILPIVSDRIGFATYSSGFFPDARALPLPFEIAELTFIATLGTAASTAETYGSAGGGLEGVGVALLDLFLTPVLFLALPITGAVLTVIIPIFGLILLSGYNRYTSLLTLGFMLLYIAYFTMFGMKTATLHPQTGLHLMHLATGIMFAVTVDRQHQIGLVSGNGYTYSDTTTNSGDESEPAVAGKQVNQNVSKATPNPPLESSNPDTDRSEPTDATETEGDVSYGGSATRSDVEGS